MPAQDRRTGMAVGGVRLAAAASVFLVSAALAADAPDPRVQPGARFTMEFPRLGDAEHGGPVRTEVFIPRDYSPDREFPLFTWFGGGAGGHSPNPAIGIVGDKGFVCAGLSYRKSTDEQRGIWRTPWSVYKAMLDAIEKAVPNIDPRNRIASGFSSGGAAVMHCIGNSGGGFQEYYYAFMPGGAGWAMGGLDTIRGRPMLIFMGDKDSRFGGYTGLEREGKAAGIDLEFLVFKGVGHEMPSSYFPQMREWIFKKVIRRDLAKTLAEMRRALDAQEGRKALDAARSIRSMTEPGMEEHAAAVAAEERLAKLGPGLAARLLAGSPTEKEMKAFVEAWRGMPSAERVVEAVNAIGEREFAKLAAAGRPSASKLRPFLKAWEGYHVRDKALAVYDSMAQEELAKVAATASTTVKKSRLKSFIRTWETGAAVAEAEELLRAAANEEALGELEKIRKLAAAPSRGPKLAAFLRKYGDVECAKEAREMLNGAAAEILGMIKAGGKPQLKTSLKGFVSLYGDTPAGEEAKGLLAEMGVK